MISSLTFSDKVEIEQIIEKYYNECFQDFIKGYVDSLRQLDYTEHYYIYILEQL